MVNWTRPCLVNFEVKQLKAFPVKIYSKYCVFNIQTNERFITIVNFPLFFVQKKIATKILIIFTISSIHFKACNSKLHRMLYNWVMDSLLGRVFLLAFLLAMHFFVSEEPSLFGDESGRVGIFSFYCDVRKTHLFCPRVHDVWNTPITLRISRHMLFPEVVILTKEERVHTMKSYILGNKKLVINCIYRWRWTY